MSSEQDIPGDITTTATLNVGDAVSSIFQLNCGDMDFFRVQLAAGFTYEFSLTDDYDGGEFSDLPSSEFNLFDDGGRLLSDSFKYDYRLRTATIQISPTYTGTFYIGANSVAIPDGTNYSIALQTMNSEYFESLLGSGGSYYFRFMKLESGFGRFDKLETFGDRDRFQVRMREGRRYQIEVLGSDSGNGTLLDPDLILYMDGQILRDDNGGKQRDARLIVTASSGGNFDLIVKGKSGTGSYKVIATEIDDYASGFQSNFYLTGFRSKVSGTIGGPDDVDWLKINMTAGRWYDFQMTTPSFRGLETPVMLLRSPDGTLVQFSGTSPAIGRLGTPSSNMRYFADTTATYYLVARSSTSRNIGDYSLEMTQTKAAINREFQNVDAGNRNIPTFLSKSVGGAPSDPIYLSALVSQTQADGLVSYDVYTPNYIYKNGIEQTRFQTYNIPIAELSQWTIRPQTYFGTVQIRANFEVSSVVSSVPVSSRWQFTQTYHASVADNFDLLDSGQYWDNPITIGTPAALPSYYSDKYANFQAITNHSQLSNAIGSAWTKWKIIDQVIPGGGESADINIFIADGVTGYVDSYLPGDGIGGDIVLNSQYYSTGSPVDSVAFHELLVAVGHALGFNRDIASARFDSVMSANENSVSSQTPTSSDLYWLEQVYGNFYSDPLREFGSLEAPTIDNRTVGAFHAYRQSIAGIDEQPELDFSQAVPVGPTNLDIRPGGFSYLQQAGGTFSLHNGINVLYRNVTGTEANDTILGNDLANVIKPGGGHDYIDPSFGNDLMIGSTGNDTYVFYFGTGDDRIREFDGQTANTGTDSVKFIQNARFSNGRTQLQELFVFERHGNDLTINLTLDNQGTEATLTIENMGLADYRVEKMNLTHLNQEISLVSAFNQLADGELRRFKVVNGSDAFGSLVTAAY